MSGSGPQSSQSSSTSAQQSVQGAAGTASPTTNIGETSDSKISINDPNLQLATVQALAQTVQMAITGAGNVAAGAQQQAAALDSSNSQTLADSLAAQQALSSYQGTNGGLQQSQTSQYIIWGAIGLAALGLLAFLFKK